MTRRRFIALVSLCMLLMLGLVAVTLVLVVTKSERGQARTREWVEGQIASSIHGRVHIGRVSGTLLTGLTVDSLEFRDDEDSLFVATGRLSVEYDPRDLVDRRVHLRRLDVEHPVVVLRQHENWSWNYKRMFALGGPQKKASSPERGFSDFVRIDSAHIRHGSFRVTIPWHPDDSLHGARRDSAVRVNIARAEHEVRRTGEGLTQTYRWLNAYAFAPYIGIADPDSVGMRFVFDTVRVDETMPPFHFRNAAGSARLLGDSVWMNISHFDLPGSRGRAEGKVWWGSDLPVRYAVRVWGDTVSMSDIAWVYPTLPTTGGGRMILDIRNERDLNQLDYAISEMDVRSTKSHLRGAMTFETGGKVLAVHDVKLQADPVDWDLLRVLNGKPFPADWQGTLTGTVTARGGPLNRFMVDASDITFHDAHVPGAVSHMTGHGELDILLPAFTAFHHFSAATDRLELRTLSRIYPAFPRITGIVSGNAVLDSSWLDVRVSNANLTHTDGPGEPSHATGGGRITYGVKFMAYDLELQASPLSLTTLARSYPKMPLRGTLSGPVRVKGIAPDLQVEADLSGSAGHIFYAGKVDADSIGGYGAKGTGRFDALNASSLLGLATPPSRLAGAYDVDLEGDSLATLVGALSVRLDASEVDGVRVTGATSRTRFNRGVMFVDQLQVEGIPGRLRAQGGFGLTRSVGVDSLVLTLDVDSLGGLRRYLTQANSGTADSLGGALSFRGAVRGDLDSLDFRGALTGRGLQQNAERAHALRGDLALRSVRGHLSGSLDLRADTLLVGGIRVNTVTLGTTLLERNRATFGGGAITDNGTQLRVAGGYQAEGDTTAIALDTLSLAIGDARWSLRKSAHVVRSAAGLTLDTLLLANTTGGRISGFAMVPETAPARARLRAESVPLAEIGRLAQLAAPVSGVAAMDVDIRGTKARPVMSMSASVNAFRIGGLSAELLGMAGAYGANRASVQANLVRNGRRVLDASVDYPVAITLFSARPLADSLHGRVHADSVDLAIMEALSNKLRNASGRLGVDLAIGGTPEHPHVGGTASLRDGAFEVPDVGLKLTTIDGLLRVDAARDSLTIDKLSWTTPGSGGSASMQGSLVFRDPKSPRFDIRLDARGLRAVDKRGLARLDVSTGASGLTLTGTPAAATLSGALNVDKGTVYIPELARKQVEDVSASDFAQLFDTTDVRNRSLMPKAPSALVEHLRLDGVSVNIGDEVWLRSKEANIKLGGSLTLTRALDERSVARSRAAGRDSAHYTLALTGALSADRGTYLLDLVAVQREFQVQSGRITFFGAADFNPAIDVTAQYQVKQANRSDIAVQARIVGNFFPQPQLEITSSDVSLSQSDIVSYLVTGRPSAELSGSDATNAQRALEFALPTLGTIGSRALRDQLGGVMDLFQIQSGAVNDQAPASTTANNNQFLSILSSTRLGGEKQISDRLFLSFSTGLCFTQTSAADDSNAGIKGFGNAIEGKLEYRFPLASPERFSLRAGREPPASALRCGANTNVRGFVQTPQQWGVSLFRSWSF